MFWNSSRIWSTPFVSNAEVYMRVIVCEGMILIGEIGGDAEEQAALFLAENNKVAFILSQ